MLGYQAVVGTKKSSQRRIEVDKQQKTWMGKFYSCANKSEGIRRDFI